MGIVFFCQSCGARFEVDPRLAGKRGHCKKCGQLMTIPRAEEIASMAAIPALATAGVGGGGAAAAAGAPGTSIASRLRAGISKVGLAPISVDRMPIGRKPHPLDDAADSKPYALAEPLRVYRGQVRAQDNAVMRAWRRQLGHIQKLLRKMSQAAYLISVPFVMILIAGIVLKNEHLAILGATAVVLLNVGRLAAGVASLGVTPFRDGIAVGKLGKQFRRVIEPVAWIAAVFLVYIFVVPWLSGGQRASGSIADRVRSGAQDLSKQMKKEVDTALDKAKAIDVEKVSAEARDELNELADKAKNVDIGKLGAQAQEKLKGLQSPPPSPAPPKDGSAGNVRSKLESQVKQVVDELKKATSPDD